MSDRDTQRYAALVHALALIIWARSVDQGDGAPCFTHLNENGFDVPADILTRLGLMTARDEGVHVFASHWRPGRPLNVTRRTGEPTVFDLIIAVMFLLDWDRNEAPAKSELPIVQPPLPNMKDDRRFLGARQIAFHKFALSKAIAALEPFGLCYWDDDVLQVVHPSMDCDPQDMLSIYYQTRAHISVS